MCKKDKALRMAIKAFKIIDKDSYLPEHLKPTIKVCQEAIKDQSQKCLYKEWYYDKSLINQINAMLERLDEIEKKLRR